MPDLKAVLDQAHVRAIEMVDLIQLVDLADTPDHGHSACRFLSPAATRTLGMRGLLACASDGEAEATCPKNLVDVGIGRADRHVKQIG